MKHIQFLLLLLTVILTTSFFISNCEKKPTAPVRDNPLDANGINYAGRAPIAMFTVVPANGNISTTFSFDASGCSDFDEPTSSLQVRWDWDGDGSYDTNYSNIKTAKHLFSDHGTKNIILQVMDNSGLTDTATQRVFIKNPYEGMIYVAGGSFQMGSDSGGSDEKPVHWVFLEAFNIDKYEVTNLKYVTYLNAALEAGEVQVNGSSISKDGIDILDLDDSDCQISYTSGNLIVDSGKDNYPVLEVTWHGAKAYADFYGKRLPTEAEWEYAARGGNLSLGYTYSGSNDIGVVAWYWNNSGSSTHPVGQQQANELGICDMSGNVWEWCNDWYESDYYSSSPSNNPSGPTMGTSRVLRGGSWNTNAYVVRSAYRGYSGDPTTSSNSIGFRCVL